MQLTEKTFFYYAKCPQWIHKNIQHGKNLDSLEFMLIDDSMDEEHKERLMKARGEYKIVRDEDTDDAFMRTLELMKEGVNTIYGAVLVDDHWVGKPDILEKVEGKSTLGDYYYIAVDIKRIHDPRQLRDGYKLQGSFYAELLDKIQKVTPTSGYVMTADGVVMRYDLEAFEAKYRLTLNEIEKILSGEEPNHVLTSGCKASPYFQACLDGETECDSLSLLNRIHTTEIEELNREGIKTVVDLVKADLQELEASILDISPERLLFLKRQATALKERLHYIVEPIAFRKSKVELYFDIEADPVKDLDYLFGVLEVVHSDDGSTTETFHAFVAESEKDEETAWNNFTEYLHEHRRAPVYHYGWYEISVCAKLIERYGAPEGAIESWENNFIDLNSVLRPAVIFPLSFYSLKDIAQYIGFTWNAEDAGGLNSIRWYHDWLETGDRKHLDKIVTYNQDDTRATYVLKEWLEKETNRE